jgi:hypothetical protein
MVDDEDAPTWLPAPCPSWCTGTHGRHDHPEDRLHRGEGLVVPAVVGRLETTRLRYRAEATELVVQRVRELPEDAPTWVVITESEGAGSALVLSAESARRLGSVLTGDG